MTNIKKISVGNQIKISFPYLWVTYFLGALFKIAEYTDKN